MISKLSFEKHLSIYYNIIGTNTIHIFHIIAPALSDGENDKLPHASKKIGIQSSDESGNFAVANASIKTGETIVVEKPIAACLLPKFFGSHCLHCLRR